jgi:hypothetical protein
MAAEAAAANHASMFRNLRALDVPASLFGPAEIAKGAVIHAVLQDVFVNLIWTFE